MKNVKRMICVLIMSICLSIMLACSTDDTHLNSNSQEEKQDIIESYEDSTVSLEYVDSFKDENTAKASIFLKKMDGVNDSDGIYMSYFKRYESDGRVNIDITYPQLSYIGDSDYETRQRINEDIYNRIIYSYFRNWISEYEEYVNTCKVTYYEKNILSFVMDETSICFGLSYDLDTGEKMKLGSLYSFVEYERILEQADNVCEEDKERLIEIISDTLKDENVQIDYEELLPEFAWTEIDNYFIWENGVGIIGVPKGASDKYHWVYYFDMKNNSIAGPYFDFE